MSFNFSLPSIGSFPRVWSSDEKLPGVVDKYSQLKETEEVDVIEAPEPYHRVLETTEYSFNDRPKPFIPENLQRLIKKGNRGTLKADDMTRLIEGIAKISIDFYELQPSKYVAIGLDGRVVESSNDKIKLLMKIQGREFNQEVFVWQVGSDSFTGWGY